METPSSARRVTRSQAMAANSAKKIPISKKIEETEMKTVTDSKQRTSLKQSALLDITNDSPIVGLAMGNLDTPSSEISKKRITLHGKNSTTPGSGEALLRCQVKTLLQKVEEEAVLSKISSVNRPFLHLKGILNSPMGLLAPTPANTPLLDLSVNDLPSVTPSPVEDKFVVSQIIDEMFEGESEKDNVTRSLLLDFSEKSEGSESSSSVVTCETKEKTPSDDDDASIWSIQVNASSTKDEEDDDMEDDDDDDVENYGVYDEDGVDELCEAISKIDVNKGQGKHCRFVYNSDGELEGAEEVMHLKGLPTPKGKHIRFPQQD